MSYQNSHMKRSRTRERLEERPVKRKRRLTSGAVLKTRALKDDEIFGDKEVWSAEKDEEERREKHRKRRKFKVTGRIEDQRRERDELQTLKTRDKKKIDRFRSTGDTQEASRAGKPTIFRRKEETRRKGKSDCSMKSKKLEGKREYWERVGREGGYRAPRTVNDAVQKFDKLPWMMEEPEKFPKPRLETLAERCLREAKVEVMKGKLIDFRRVPDDFVYSILEGSASAVALERIEEKSPDKAVVLDAIWATLCQAEYQIEELPEAIPRWKGLYEIKREERDTDYKKAKERLQKRYALIDAQKQKRQLSTTLLKPIRTTTKTYGNRNPAGRSAIERLRTELRRARAR